ncbi:hypothetical protein S245_040793, partial [Arachis hypogaea]
MECRSTRGQTVIPLFYYVDPEYVRRQLGPAFSQTYSYENEIVHAWRAALTDAANLPGIVINRG